MRCDAEGILNAQRAAGFDVAIQVDTLNQLHRIEVRIAFLAPQIYQGNIFVIDFTGQLRLAQEPAPDAIVSEELRLNDLEEQPRGHPSRFAGRGR